MFLNKAIIIGNLTRDPELKSLPSGVKVSSFGVATNHVYKDASGERKENTEFHNITVFGRQAENIVQYLRKGSTVLLEGRIQTRSWEAQDGTKRSRTEIVADRVQFGPKKEGGGYTPQQGQTSAPKKKDEVDTIEYPDGDINPEDIPF